MSRYTDDGRDMRLDPDSFAGGYFKHAVYNHWDPYEDVPASDLETDRERLVADEPTEAEYDEFRKLVAQFGAGEEAVTEDLAPMMLALDDIDDQMFVASQIYEEAKHTQFFDRYWRAVVDPVAEDLGFEVTAPTDQRYFNEDYVAIFEKTEAAMDRLLADDSPEQMARAISHYHLVVESVLAQTGYYAFQSIWSDTGETDAARREFPTLPGVLQGVTYIRSDEGRHVGWGMRKVRDLVQHEGVDERVVRDTLQELMAHVAATNATYGEVSKPAEFIQYSREKLTRRIEIITDAEAEVPPVEELVAIEGADEAGAAD